eukprot:TRINITY_DN10924_c0_g1_i1.p1 TRINITY_DN10924_c0_g1~~TRINITY_DN10924_c0_g1_i1.p1  ORF type:complete len:504 (+),score=84.05 TRINITY_DN10924_c0_g1_i1:145-1656(+)
MEVEPLAGEGTEGGRGRGGTSHGGGGGTRRARAPVVSRISRQQPPTHAGGRAVCRYFLEGRCRYGEACQFLHPQASGGEGAGGSITEAQASAPGGKRGMEEMNGESLAERSGRRQKSLSHMDQTPAFFSQANARAEPARNSAAFRRKGRAPLTGQRREGAPAPVGPCRRWLAGKCDIPDGRCKYLHEHSTTKEVMMIAKLKGTEGKAVRAIDLPEGSLCLYVATSDGCVTSWNGTTGEFVRRDNLRGGDASALASSGGILFVGMSDMLKAWNFNTGEQQKLPGAAGQVHCLLLSQNVLFAGCSSGMILCWKYDEGSSIFTPAVSLAGHELGVLALQLASSLLYSASMDHTIRVWDLSNASCIQVLSGHTEPIMALVCWEGYLLSCSLDGFVKVWETNTSRQLELKYSLAPSSTPGRKETQVALTMAGAIDASNKPVLLVSVTDKGNNIVYLYDLPSFALRGQLFTPEDVRAIHVGPDGLFFTGDSNGEVTVWKFASVPNGASE